MNLRKASLLLVLLLLPFALNAQKKKKRVVRKPVAVVEQPQEDPRITNMREMTQQIVIIDSIVVDKDQILSHLCLSAETGTVMTSKEFFQTDDSGYVFLNEMGNKVYFSQPDDSLHQHLLTSDRLGNEWSQPVPVLGINEGMTDTAYPFMLTDGLTFYFAGKGEDSIGGYDIFFTRYDSRNGRFFKPENIGMPFNSEANDYMYAIDETNRIGYFVSDRRQPEGKVCIYVFVPSETRKTYDLAAYSEQQIRDFADITRIADTWGNGKERKAALTRWRSLAKNPSVKNAPKGPSSTANLLIIDDTHIYNSPADCRSANAATLYEQLITARRQMATLDKELQEARDTYADANRSERQAMSREIIKAEQESVTLNKRIRQLEKQIRSEEKKQLTY